MRSLLRRLRNEQGIALVMALGTLITMSTVTTALLTYSASGVRTVRYTDGVLAARNLAEAGLADAEAILNNSSTNASSPTLLGCSVSPTNVNNSALPCTDLTVAYPTGTASYHGIYTQGSNNGTWTITGTGTVRNPRGGAAVVKTMTAAVTVTGGGQGNNISVWNYVYSTAPQTAGCEVDLNGDHTDINVPLYVTGDLCLTGNHATVTEDKESGGQAVDIRVKGGLTITGNDASIGKDASHRLTSGIVEGGCRTSATGTYHACTTLDDYYVNQLDTPLTATPPVTDFPSWYLNASPGPNHPCDPTLTPAPNLMTTQPRAFDSDTTMNGTNTLFILTPTGAGTDYNCVTSTGSLSWNHTTHLLTISGTVFLDGNVQLNDDKSIYDGKATVYVNGLLDFNDGHGGHAGIRANCPGNDGKPKQCGINKGPGEDHWDPNADMIIFAVNKSTGIAVDMTTDHTEFQGDLICPPTATAALAGDHTVIEGGIICGRFTWADHTKIYPMPTITTLPPGAPIPPNAPATISVPVLSD